MTDESRLEHHQIWAAFLSDVENKYGIYWNSFLPIFFDRMNSLMRKQMTNYVSKYGLTSSHAVYLIALAIDGPKSQKELSSFLDMDVANTCRVLKVLREKGMIYDDRKSDGDKNYRIHLTAIGKEVGEGVMASTESWMDSMMAGVDQNEMIMMRRTLLKILNNMDPNIDTYMGSKHANTFYTYLGTNPSDEPEGVFQSRRLSDKEYSCSVEQKGNDDVQKN